MVYFIFTEHFPLVGNLTLGQLKAHGHEHMRTCLGLPLPYQPNEISAGSCACPRAPDSQREKRV